MPAQTKTRQLVVVLGDQLNVASAAFDDFEPQHDVVWMAEVAEEANHVWSHKARIAVFLSGMRHFRDALRKKGMTVDYRQLDDRDNQGGFAEEFRQACRRLSPERIVLVEPGEYRVKQMFQDTAAELGLEIEIRADRHFLCTHEQFAEHAEGRKQLRLEYFYREMRRQHDVLMQGGKPLGGKWNYDAENRGSFKKSGPQDLAAPRRFRPDAITKEVLALVNAKFPDHPGSLKQFDWPVTTKQAKQALDDFLQNRLAHFGEYQDAMWTDEPYLYHSRISVGLNLKLLDPRDAIEGAVAAYHAGLAPLNAVEGFVRQVLGWREYVRAIYWRYMPEYAKRNTLNARQPLPDFYWNGDTEMHCLQQAIKQTLEYGYAHHIQRLMVTGLFGLLLGVDPEAIHRWYLAVYVDAVEWVELPNSLGMSQFADDGVMASKPYAATGKYIQRMSNYCASCRFKPERATGEDACPFTTLYWDFLDRHADLLSKNQRMSLQVKNLDRKSKTELDEIREQAAKLKSQLAAVAGTGCAQK